MFWGQSEMDYPHMLWHCVLTCGFSHYSMYCLKCGALEDKVIDSRLAKDGKSIRRRRECEGCGFRYTTYEVIEQVELRVVKKDGSSEPFDRAKVLGGC